MSFDRLLYTDCLPGQGRAGTGGFQVQARSAGVDSTQERAAVGALLYEAQDTWIVEERPVEEFPLGLAHSCTEGLGTAQSRYLGKEANGSRPGNYLADCLLTRDPSAYGVVRPAQLWQAPFWRATAWATTDCPPFDGALEPGPLDADGLAEWIRADPRRAPALARLLTVLESPDRKVTVLSEEPEAAVRWIAAATLLLPMADALRISFKVFTANAGRAEQRVLGLPRSLNPQVAPGAGRTAFVLDADTGACDDVPVSDRAAEWVQRFGDADPFDVVDAVELAGQLRGSGAETAQVRTTAWLMVADEEPVPDPVPVLEFLAAAPPEVRAGHAGDVARRLLSAELDAAQLRTVLAVLGEQPDPGVRRRLLAAELDEVRAGRTPQAAPLPPAPMDAQSRGDMESAISSAVLLGRDAEVAGVLQVAARHGVAPPVGPLVPRLELFVQGWVDDAALPVDPERSIWREELLALLQEEVRCRFTRGLPEQATPLLLRFGPYLAQDRPLVDDAFEVEVFAASATRLPPEEIADRVHAAIADVASARDANRAAEVLQAALMRWRVVDGALACWLVRALPAGVVPAADLAALAADGLKRLARPTSADLDALRRLRQHYDVQSTGLDALAESDLALTARLTQLTRVSGRELAAQVAGVAALDPAVLRARRGNVLGVAVGSRTPEIGAALLAKLPKEQSRGLAKAWVAEIDARPTRRALTWGVEWSAHDAVPDDVRRTLQDRLTAVLDGLEEPARTELVEAVATELSPGAAAVWEQLHTPSASRKDRFRSRLHRG